jgi:hypothetical protein
MKYRFYITDMAPNGTRDLLVTDDYNQLVEVLTESIFGRVNVADTCGMILVADDRSVWGIEDYKQNEEVIESIKNGYSCDHTLVEQALYPFQLLKAIAVSPVDDGAETAKIIKKYLNA